MRSAKAPRLEPAGPVQPPDGVPSLCLTPTATADLLRTIGPLPPESGALGFGPADRLGVDLVEFDESGSAAASRAVYSPDVDWCRSRVRHHLAASRLRLWTAILHSHPDGYTRPSVKAGPARGDLGYVAAVFQANEAMRWFAIPILTGSGTGAVTLHPWICERTADSVAVHLTALRICEVDEFPIRQFNTAWERTVEKPALPPHATHSARPSLPAVDVFVLARALRRSVAVSWQGFGPALVVAEGDFKARLVLRDGFPVQPPSVTILYGQEVVPLHFRWLEGSAVPIEQRLARLVGHALRVGRETF